MPESVRFTSNREVVIQLVDYIIAAFEHKRHMVTQTGQAITPIDQLMVAHNFHKAMVLGACTIAPGDHERLQILHLASTTWVDMIMHEMEKLTPKPPFLGAPDADDSPISMG